MRGRSAALLTFTVRIPATLLHKLVQALVSRAYELGYEDAESGKARDSSRVNIDPSQIRKLQP